MKRLKYFVFICVLLLISGCGSSNNQPIKTDDSPSFIVPEPSVDTGVVVGKLTTSNYQNLTGLILYLGDLATSESGLAVGVLDINNALKAVINEETGDFYFDKVKPGQYSLIIYEVVLGGKVNLDADGKILIVTAEANKTTNLGDILYEEN